MVRWQTIGKMNINDKISKIGYIQFLQNIFENLSPDIKIYFHNNDIVMEYDNHKNHTRKKIRIAINDENEYTVKLLLNTTIQFIKTLINEKEEI